MRRLPVLAVAIATMGLGVACVPQPPPPPPPNPVCQAEPAPPAPTTPSAQVKLTQLNTLAGAIAMATRTNDATLYVATQSGHLYADVVPARLRVEVLNLSSLVNQSGGELGLLGMTFSPDGSKLYVHYSAIGSGDTTVDEFAVGTAAPAVATFGGAGSRRPVLTAPGLEANHNGGSLLFGPDNMLYIAIGDGGGGNDDFPGYSSHGPGGNGQNINTLQGKILRINPADPAPPGGFGLGLSYTAPPDNPFVGTAGADEVWSFGLRNPFRISFDKTTRDLWIADVGQSAREEVDFVAAGDASHPGGKAANFGWNRCEGKTAGPDGTPPNGAGGTVVQPIFDMSHAAGDCAIIGGYVYRGLAVPALGNDYLYTDNCNGKIRALTRSGMSVTNRDLGVGVSSPSSFGQDNTGELYVLSLASGGTGGLYRIDHL